MYDYQKLFKAFGLDSNGRRPDGTRFGRSCCSTPKQASNSVNSGNSSNSVNSGSSYTDSFFTDKPRKESYTLATNNFFDTEMAAAAARNAAERGEKGHFSQNLNQGLNARPNLNANAPPDLTLTLQPSKVSTVDVLKILPPNFPFPAETQTANLIPKEKPTLDASLAKSWTPFLAAGTGRKDDLLTFLEKETRATPAQQSTERDQKAATKDCSEQVGLAIFPGQKYYRTAAFREHIASILQSQKKAVEWSRAQIDSHFKAYQLAEKTVEEAQLALQRLKLKSPRSIATQELIEQNIIRRRIAASEALFHAEMLKAWRAYGTRAQQLINRLSWHKEQNSL